MKFLNVRPAILAIISVIMLGHLASTAFAQSESNDGLNKLIFSQNGIVISSTSGNCENINSGTAKEYVFVSIRNENDYPVDVSFKNDAWYNGKCNSCNSASDEYLVTIEVDGGTEISGTCEENLSLSIFSKMLNLDKVRKLTHFELTDITIHESK